MVVEMLTFQVDPADQPTWLAVEESVWTEYLTRQPGFARKQVWRDVDRRDLITAVIWWESKDLWKRISPADVEAVDARMGEWFRESVMTEFEV
ncbi:MAG: TIGR03792 family protein, partial [Acidimicrobiia bacterium]|nr:TIGR03792 family protein [Acidimicrobiia bacterium]